MYNFVTTNPIRVSVDSHHDHLYIHNTDILTGEAVGEICVSISNADDFLALIYDALNIPSPLTDDWNILNGDEDNLPDRYDRYLVRDKAGIYDCLDFRVDDVESRGTWLSRVDIWTFLPDQTV